MQFDLVKAFVKIICEIPLLIKSFINSFKKFLKTKKELEDIPKNNVNFFMLFKIILKLLFGEKKNNFDVYTAASDLFSKSPKISHGWFGFYNFVDVRDPDYIRIILNSHDCINRSDGYSIPYKTGLLATGGEIWRKHRKLLNPAFSRSSLAHYLPMVNEKSKILIEMLEGNLNENFNVFRILTAFTLDSLMKTSFDLDKNFLRNPYDKFFDCVKHEASTIGQNFSNIFKRFLSFLNENRETEFVSFAEQILKESFTNLHNCYENEESPNWIKILLKNKKVLSDQEIMDEVSTLVMAGNASTSLTISAALLMLAMHPEVQEKVVKELESVFTFNDEDTDEINIQKLVYLECVIKETMRLFTVAPVIGRKTSDYVQLDDSIILPKGVNILIRIFDLHRDPRHWGSDANKFKPERFLPENFNKINPYAFIPFSNGMRICIGYKYTMNTMKTALSHILRNYHISTDLKFDEIKLKMSFVLRIAGGYIISIRKREFSC